MITEHYVVSRYYAIMYARYLRPIKRFCDISPVKRLAVHVENMEIPDTLRESIVGPYDLSQIHSIHHTTTLVFKRRAKCEHSDISARDDDQIVSQ